MNKIENYSKFISSALANQKFPNQPINLYQPISYLLKLEGKRMRPILTLMAAEMFSKEHTSAKNAALSLEIFHNFTLIHDDIMDHAPMRRGAETIHKKWNENIAILSGDTLLIEAYKRLSSYPQAILPNLLKLFNKSAIDVCEGQQMDMDFENREDVKISDYVEMIRLKTAVLLGCSLKVGAIVGGATEESAQELYEFGCNLGLAFQLQDDILDVYGAKEKFGKQIGGDILANKKTYLLLTAIEDANQTQKNLLKILANEADHKTKVRKVTELYNQLNVEGKSEEQVNRFFNIAINHLNSIQLSESSKSPLKSLAYTLLMRDS